ncbi:MAG TPA: hypothetical protein PLQ01_05020 [Methanothrix sp.]|nr:hypothetical protein [Methanothrix sp.]
MNVIKKIFGMLLGFAIGIIILAAIVPTPEAVDANTPAPSVTIDGWQFVLAERLRFVQDENGWTENGWTVRDHPEIQAYDSKKPTDSCDARGHWVGNSVIPFYFPAYPNAPKGNAYYDVNSGYVEIKVIKIPNDLRRDIQDHNIAVYGSPDKVPADVKKKEIEEILADAIKTLPWCLVDCVEKSTTFNGRQAYMSTRGGDVAMCAVLLDDNTVGLILVMVEKAPSGDEARYDGQAEDVLDAITIERKGA